MFNINYFKNVATQVTDANGTHIEFRPSLDSIVASVATQGASIAKDPSYLSIRGVGVPMPAFNPVSNSSVQSSISPNSNIIAIQYTVLDLSEALLERGVYQYTFNDGDDVGLSTMSFAEKILKENKFKNSIIT